MPVEKASPCKINLILNILGRRPDGFHELETLLQPIPLCDRLTFERGGHGIRLSCSHSQLPIDSKNLVHRAAAVFLTRLSRPEGVAIHLEKIVPMEAGLGGGSGDAAVTLLGLNELFGEPLGFGNLQELAAGLGSDVPFFLQPRPALATGRGEIIQEQEPFPALARTVVLLVHPGFGIPTAWAYQALSRFPESLNGRPGRARALADLLQHASLAEAGAQFYNSLEAPALEKFPLLALLKDFLRNQGAPAVLMSGSGSTVFAILPDLGAARSMEAAVQSEFGPCWSAVVPVHAP
jgi:4-diphosphocytidyl-2-C-methyl-D-erythritol kinase